MKSETTSVQNIFEVIENIKARPALFFGDSKITSLNAFLHGYDFCESVNGKQQNHVFPPFWYFNEWAMHKYNWPESTAGWKNIILQENQNDEEKALKVFFEMIEEFKTLHPLSIQKLILTDQHLTFHHSEQCAIKRGDKKPIYVKADEILIVEFSHSFGFSFFVLSNGRHIGGWPDRFKNLVSAKDGIERLFGHVDDFRNLTGDLVKIVKQIL
jgi:hypothetical protein